VESQAKVALAIWMFLNYEWTRRSFL